MPKANITERTDAPRERETAEARARLERRAADEITEREKAAVSHIMPSRSASR